MVDTKATLLKTLHVNSHVLGYDRAVYNELSNYGDSFLSLCKKNGKLISMFSVLDTDFARRIFDDNQLAEYRKILDSQLLDFLTLYSVYQHTRIPSTTCLDELCTTGAKYLDYDEILGALHDELFNICIRVPEYMRSVCVYNYIIKYIVKKHSGKLNIPIPACVISDYRYDAGMKQTDPEGAYNYALDMICINKKLVNSLCMKHANTSKLTYIIHVVLHELKHAKQWHDTDLGIVSKESYDYIRRLIFDHYLNKSDEYNEYRTNYRYDEIEIGAELSSWSATYKLLGEKGLLTEKDKKGILNNIDTLRYKNLIRVKQNNEDFPILASDYNIGQLSQILDYHSQIVRTYPLLKWFYHSTGRLRDFPGLLESEKKYSKNNSNSALKPVFIDYYRFLLNTTFEVDAILKLSPAIQRPIIAKTFDILISDLQNIKDSLIMYFPNGPINENAMEVVTRERVDSAIRIYGILDDYYVKVMNNTKLKNEVLCLYSVKLIIVKRLLKEIRQLMVKKPDFQNYWVCADIKRVLKIKVNRDYNLK